MDIRILLTALATVVMVVLCQATSDADQAIQVIGQLTYLSVLFSRNLSERIESRNTAVIFTVRCHSKSSVRPSLPPSGPSVCM